MAGPATMAEIVILRDLHVSKPPFNLHRLLLACQLNLSNADMIVTVHGEHTIRWWIATRTRSKRRRKEGTKTEHNTTQHSNSNNN